MGIPSRNAQLLETALDPCVEYSRQKPTTRLSKRDLLLVLQEANGNGTTHIQRIIRTTENYVSRGRPDVPRP